MNFLLFPSNIYYPIQVFTIPFNNLLIPVRFLLFHINFLVIYITEICTPVKYKLQSINYEKISTVIHESFGFLFYALCTK